MKMCTKCSVEKPEDEFPWRKRDVRRASTCKVCQRVLAQQHYKSNKQYYKNKNHVSRDSIRIRGKAFVIEYLQSHPCVDCGESDIEVLQFDHIEPLENWRAPRVTTLVAQSIRRIQVEIDKCEVRCANCHVRRTRQMNGTLRLGTRE